MRAVRRAAALVLALFIAAAGDAVPGKNPCGGAQIARGICPEARKTARAPARDLKRKNPLPATREHIEKGRRLYVEEARPTPCRLCHGAYGRGDGRLSQGLAPPPRNFACRDTMHKLGDGQWFWIIKKGSPGTGMPAHKRTLKDEDIWRLILYIRRFAMPEKNL
jgi:mono/diheme cytochrome c family protein